MAITLFKLWRNKWRYLRDYLTRNTRNSLENCMSELRGLESQARRCYFEEMNLQSDQFLKMMLLDGCFIIEFLIKLYLNVQDMIFDMGWALPIIRSDLLLLENQIPFFVIQKLFCLLTCSGPIPTEENTTVVPNIAPLEKMLLDYLSEGKKVGHPVLAHVEIKHILHLYHLCYVPSLLTLCPPGRTKSTSARSLRTIPSATELNEAGIVFKCAKSEKILDVNFQNGTLEIPFITIEETRRSRLLNLLSFEQCDSKLDMNLTSYACFMGSLFKTAKDVSLLQEKGIVDNLLATNEELVSFFNWLTECSYLDYDAHYLKELFIDVNRYYISDVHRWRATLKRNYFSNP